MNGHNHQKGWEGKERENKKLVLLITWSQLRPLILVLINKCLIWWQKKCFIGTLTDWICPFKGMASVYKPADALLFTKGIYLIDRTVDSFISSVPGNQVIDWSAARVPISVMHVLIDSLIERLDEWPADWQIYWLVKQLSGRLADLLIRTGLFKGGLR